MSLSTRPCSHMNSWATTYMPSTTRISRASSPKSIPCPGTKAMPESMSAAWPFPVARSPSITWSRVRSAGIWADRTPPKITFMASPRMEGAHTLKTTATTTIATTAIIPTFSAPKVANSRLAEGQKALALRGAPPPHSSVTPCSWNWAISSSVRSVVVVSCFLVLPRFSFAADEPRVFACLPLMPAPPR